jgi:hypothetical protein
VKNQRKTEKSQKISQNDLFSVMVQKNFLYEAEKKIIKKTPFFEQKIFIDGKVFSERLENNYEAAQKALNKKETLFSKRASFYRIKFKTHSNNSKDFPVQRVNCYRIRTTSNEKPNELFNKEYSTNDIFCEFFI